MRTNLIIYPLFFALPVLGQRAFSPHVVYDSANNLYADKISSKLFLKLIDSSDYNYMPRKNINDYFKCKCSMQKVALGHESTFISKEEAQALLNYWSFLNDIKFEKKKPRYSP